MSNYLENFIKKVIDNSVSNNWEGAVAEWDIVDFDEDKDLSSSCICGKEGIKYLYRIKNRFNNEELFPIGSTCINKFEREDLDEFVQINIAMYKLMDAVEEGVYITLDTKYFSRKLLEYFHAEGVFSDNKYNDYNGYNDYKFMLEMFNKRDKDTISPKQQKKINALIMNNIMPYLIDRLKKKKI